MDAVAVERHCPECGALIASTRRPDRKFCGAACRQAAYERRRGKVTRARETSSDRDPGATLLEFERARDQGREEEFLVGLIVKAAETQWRTAAFVLERRFPSRWAVVRRGENRPSSEPDALLEDDPFAEVVKLADRRRRLRGD
jgi:predicted nucleic acid-binding Zn ribbon protein